MRRKKMSILTCNAHILGTFRWNRVRGKGALGGVATDLKM